MTDQNRNAIPEESSEPPIGIRSRTASLATTSSARGDRAGTAHGNGDRASVSTPRSRSFVTYFLLLVRDLLTFFVRGGISAMMFAMDQILRVGLLGADVIIGPTGANVLGYPCRAAMWVYQILLWVAYTVLELLLYLPWPVLLIYIIVLTVMLLWLPAPVTTIFKQLFVTLHRFIGLYKNVFGLIKG